MKICGFLIICCCWIIIVSQCDAETVNCECRNGTYWLDTRLKNTTISGYFCKLMSGSTNSVDVDSIKGSHDAGKGDDDVKILRNWSNNLKTFASIFCQKFKNLEYIDIGGAEIGSIDENSLRNCENLDIIDLSGNKLREVPENLLAENSKLTQVWIWKNDLTTLPENFFQNQNQLQQLVLKENQISFLPPKIFNPLVKLQLLDLRNNKLQVLDPEWFVNLKSLKLLSLSQNQISEVPGGIFKSLKSLEELWLYENKIKTLSPNSFDGLQNLVQLSLSKNEISDLPRGVFVPLKNLKWLYLYSNKLTVIHSDSFGSHNNLIQIDLQNNKITALDEKIIDNAAVKFLDMTNNSCYNGDIQVRSEIKEKLQNCFRNYQPRSAATSINCGRSMAIKERIIGGGSIIPLSYPWIAALVKSNGDYFCGGTLVTDKKVVTAAHCIHQKRTRMPILLRDFFVFLGIHDLEAKVEAGRTAYVVASISMHDDWNPNSDRYDADIAVLVLEQTVIFTLYIQPICLIEPSSNIASITDGIVVGFGKSEDRTKLHENIAKELATPIHGNEDCFLTYYNLAMFASKRTFCGGTGNGEGVCDGDSGSGLFVLHENVYYLRGIVSSSLHNRTYGCDVNTYAVYTDMLKFNDWVNGISEEY